MAAPDTSRSPCPDRLLDDVGGGFGLGVVGGSAFYFLKGIYNSPKGERIIGGLQGVRMNVPSVGGSFAAWEGVFSVFDCSMVYLRQKEDPWNSILASTAAVGFLQMRQGLGPASRSALFGGALFALMEGARIMIKATSEAQNLPIFVEDIPDELSNNAHFPNNMDPPQRAASTSPWYARWFGGGSPRPPTSGLK